MNTLEELQEYGFDITTSNNMINSYIKRIGTNNGIYNIKDIVYNPCNNSKIVYLKCNKCGKEITRELINGRNKWSELISHCSCEKQEKIRLQKEESEKILKNKKALIDSQIGKKINSFVITAYKDGTFLAECEKCGKKVKFNEYYYFKGTYKDRYCGNCKQAEHIRYDDSYIGRKKNYLTVVSIIYNDKNHRKFLCQCDCGNLTTVEPNNFEYETIKSCGCKHDELSAIGNRTQDGISSMRIYDVWRSMMYRCYNRSANGFRNYGGRGITVCEEWHNVKTFAEWAYANGYDDKAPRGECTIDRINVNGNYEPSNCRWIPTSEQQKNKRPSSEWKKRDRIQFEYNGAMYNIDELSRFSTVNKETLLYRMNVKKMTVKDAVESPKNPNGRPRKAV